MYLCQSKYNSSAGFLLLQFLPNYAYIFRILLLSTISALICSFQIWRECFCQKKKLQLKKLLCLLKVVLYAIILILFNFNLHELNNFVFILDDKTVFFFKWKIFGDCVNSLVSFFFQTLLYFFNLRLNCQFWKHRNKAIKQLAAKNLMNSENLFWKKTIAISFYSPVNFLID